MSPDTPEPLDDLERHTLAIADEAAKLRSARWLNGAAQESNLSIVGLLRLTVLKTVRRQRTTRRVAHVRAICNPLQTLAFSVHGAKRRRQSRATFAGGLSRPAPWATRTSTVTLKHAKIGAEDDPGADA